MSDCGNRAGSLDKEQVALGIRTDDPDLLDRGPLVAHVTGHPHALVDAAGGRARPDRARLAMMVRAVGLRAAIEVVALDVSGEALALRDARDVDELARAEQVGQLLWPTS